MSVTHARNRDAANVSPEISPRSFHFLPEEWLRIAGLYAVVGLLHLLGWGLYVYYCTRYPALVGLGLAAYFFGLRHAFDADHIAAIDDTVRYMLHKGARPLGVGFFFSLGHSTIVFVLALLVALAAPTITREIPQLQSVGGVIGATVSGVFLWIVGILNLLILLDMLNVRQRRGTHVHNHPDPDTLLGQRGLLNRLCGGRLTRLMNQSWQMYPLGVLFGLGFDTASEVALLAMTAGAAAGALPIPAVLGLAILFAAGMTLLDTTDGILMCKAYDWALLNPVRRLFYNVTTTGLSAGVALGVGSMELLQAIVRQLRLHGGLYDSIDRFDFGSLGYVIAGFFLLAWGCSAAVWKLTGPGAERIRAD